MSLRVRMTFNCKFQFGRKIGTDKKGIKSRFTKRILFFFLKTFTVVFVRFNNACTTLKIGFFLQIENYIDLYCK